MIQYYIGSRYGGPFPEGPDDGIHLSDDSNLRYGDIQRDLDQISFVIGELCIKNVGHGKLDYYIFPRKKDWNQFIADEVALEVELSADEGCTWTARMLFTPHEDILCLDVPESIPPSHVRMHLVSPDGRATRWITKRLTLLLSPEERRAGLVRDGVLLHEGVL
jgi:hypothetical protein